MQAAGLSLFVGCSMLRLGVKPGPRQLLPVAALVRGASARCAAVRALAALTRVQQEVLHAWAEAGRVARGGRDAQHCACPAHTAAAEQHCTWRPIFGHSQSSATRATAPVPHTPTHTDKHARPTSAPRAPAQRQDHHERGDLVPREDERRDLLQRARHGPRGLVHQVLQPSAACCVTHSGASGALCGALCGAAAGVVWRVVWRRLLALCGALCGAGCWRMCRRAYDTMHAVFVHSPRAAHLAQRDAVVARLVRAVPDAPARGRGGTVCTGATCEGASRASTKRQTAPLRGARVQRGPWRPPIASPVNARTHANTLTCTLPRARPRARAAP